MKFTLLEPCDEKFYHSEVSAPLGLAYVASFLDKELDYSIETDIETDVNYVLKNKPDIVGISAYTQNFNRALNAAKLIKKELNIPVILGGKHVTVLPEALPDCFDVGVVGDGERTMAELMKLFVEKKQFHPEDLINVQGLVFKDGNNIHITPQRDTLSDLDFLPPPKRELLNPYSPILKRKIQLHQGLYTSRGCPYKCPFCIHSKIKFVSRYHSTERVVREIEEIIAKFPEQKTISIYDDLFIISKKRLKELKDLIVSEKINRKVSFTAMCKANHFDEDIASMLREMNVKFVAFGFESGDEKTLQYLKKDSSKVSQNLESVRLCNKYGIENGGYFIIGAHTEDKKALAKTYWFIRSNKPPMKFVGVTFLTALPGTKEWDLAVEKKLVDPENENWDIFRYDNYDINQKTFSNENYSFEFLKDAYDNWFSTIFMNDKSLAIKHSPESIKKEFHLKMAKELEELNITDNDSILELGTQFNYTFKDWLPDNKNISIFDHRNYRLSAEKLLEEEKILENKKFDYIVFTFSLEEMINPYERLKNLVDNYLNENGKLVIFTKNPKFIYNFFNLLSKTFNKNRPKETNKDNLFSINIKQLKDFISNKLGFNLKEKVIKEDVKDFSVFYNHTINIISNHIPKVDEYVKVSDISDYIFIAGK